MKYRGFTLDRFQSEAIAALRLGESVLVSAPTGTGKTVVADWMVEECLSKGTEIIYTAPIKALSNQKYRDYCSLIGEEKVGLVTGDLVIRRDAPCRVMTTEILRNMLLTGEQVPQLSAVIIDEIHFLDDLERGTTWEELLIYLPSHVQIIGLSATLSNLHEFAAWLTQVRENKVSVIEERRRNVPLAYRIATSEGGLKSPKDMKSYHRTWFKRNAQRIKQLRQQKRDRHRRHGRQRQKLSRNTSHIDIFEMLVDEHLPYLYFVFSRKQTEALSRVLGRTIGRRNYSLLNYEEKETMAQRLAEFRSQAGCDVLTEELSELYSLGIGFHHAGLHVLLKNLVESLYEAKLIKVLYCTGTFALGINMPARSAVFDDLSRYNGTEMIPLPTREFMQMAGRAGRRGMDTEGTVVVRTTLDDYRRLAPQLGSYFSGDYEGVTSRFSLSFNSVINLLERHPPDRIRQIVEKSFLAFQREQMSGEYAAQAKKLEAELAEMNWDGSKTPRPAIKNRVKRLKKLRRRARGGSERSWAEFEEKVQFLVDSGYLGTDLTFNVGANVLKRLQIQELFATELVLQGFFEDLEPELLFGVCCGMVAELPRGVVVHSARRFRGIGRQIQGVCDSPVVIGGEEFTGLAVTWDYEMIPIGVLWAEGKTLNEIVAEVNSPTDISGSLVGAFRRAKDLVSQLMTVWADDPERVATLKSLIKTVRRDEVEVVA